MMKKIELLIIELAGRLIGIEGNEVKRVIPNASNEKNVKLINEFNKSGRYFRLGEVMKINEIIDYSSLILLEEDRNDLLVLSPAIDNMVKIDAKDIMTLPDFIKKRQDPLFVWGFAEIGDKLASLVTFSFFSIKGRI